MAKILQTPIASWPKGLCREIAVMAEHKVACLNLAFERDFDDLDYFFAAILTSADQLYALRRYENQPSPGYTLIARDNDQSATELLSTFLSMTGLDEEDVTWRCDPAQD